MKLRVWHVLAACVLFSLAVWAGAWWLLRLVAG